MPISYEPMQPFDKSVYEAYGASQARQQANEMALRAYGSTQASADRRQEMAQQEEQFNASYQQRFQLQDSAQAHDFAQAQQHTDLQAQLSQTQLNQAENMRLQRLDRQIEYVQANSGPGQQYTPQEAQEMIGDLRMGRDPLQARAQRAQILHSQAQTQQITQQMAHQDSLDALRRAQQGQTGAAGTFQMPDPSDPTGQTKLPGLYYRDHQGNPQIVPSSSGTGSRASGAGSVPGAIMPQIDSAINHATQTIDRALSATGDQALPENHPFRRDRATAILQLAREHREASEALQAEDRDVRSRLAGGPLPFDVPPAGAPDANGMIQNAMQRGVNNAIRAAESRNAPRESERFRAIAGELNAGRTTGDLTPSQQETLRQTGYYGQGFTPQIDRQISAAIIQPAQVINQGGQRVVMRPNPPPEMQQAAQELRTLLSAFDGPPPESRPMALARFNELRGRIGLSTWPPPLSRHSDQPTRAPISPDQVPAATSNAAIRPRNPYAYHRTDE